MLAKLSEEEEKVKERMKQFARFVSAWFGTFATVFRDAESLVGHKTLEDDWYVVIKASMYTVPEIWRDFFVLAYIVCLSYPYQLYDMASQSK